MGRVRTKTTKRASRGKCHDEGDDLIRHRQGKRENENESETLSVGRRLMGVRVSC